MLRRVSLVAALLVLAAHSQAVDACGFKEGAAHVVTLREDAATSQIVIFAELANARGGPEDGTTDLVIIKTLKGAPVLDGKKVVRVPHYIPILDPKNPPRLLAFAHVTNGEADFFKAVPATPALVDYVEGVMAVESKDRVKLLRYYSDYLDHEDPAVAADAYGEFLKSTDPEIRDAGRTLSAEKLRRWLQSDQTPPDRLRLYAFLLGNCGEQQDAALLRKLMDKLVKQQSPPLLDGVLTGYTLLSPKEGWNYTRGLLKDPARSFQVRYAALRAARYFHTTQPGFVAEDDIVEAVSPTLDQSDIADITIDYLRRWKCWKLTEPILALYDAKGLDAPMIPLIRRSLLCYAIQCPDAEAVRFMAEARKADPSLVADAVEMLKAEAAPASQKP